MHDRLGRPKGGVDTADVDLNYQIGYMVRWPCAPNLNLSGGNST